MITSLVLNCITSINTSLVFIFEQHMALLTPNKQVSPLSQVNVNMYVRLPSSLGLRVVRNGKAQESWSPG